MLNKGKILDKIKKMKPVSTPIEGGIQLAEVLNFGFIDMESISFTNEKQFFSINILGFANQFITVPPLPDEKIWTEHVSSCWINNLILKSGSFINPIDSSKRDLFFTCSNLSVIKKLLQKNLFNVNDAILKGQEEALNSFSNSIIDSYSEIKIIAYFSDPENVIFSIPSTVK